MNRSANSTDDPGDPRLMTGEAWDEFCDSLKRAGRLVLGEDVPDSPRDRSISRSRMYDAC